MKTKDDFVIEKGIAFLKGISFAEEAKVVYDFLKVNQDIEYASVVTNDNRYFELKGEKLVRTDNTSFKNPFYKILGETNHKQSVILDNNNKMKNLNKNEIKIEYAEKDIVDKINNIELRLSKLESILNKIKLIVNE